MKLKLVLNIGTIDDRRLGLTKTLEGETVTVDEKVGTELLKKGWAVKPGEEGDLPPGVEPKPLLSSKQLPIDQGAVQPDVARPHQIGGDDAPDAKKGTKKA